METRLEAAIGRGEVGTMLLHEALVAHAARQGKIKKKKCEKTAQTQIFAVNTQFPAPRYGVQPVNLE